MAIHCFYHGIDLDGHCSGAIVKYRFSTAVMHPINYGDDFPWDEIKGDDEVYMVDFCLQLFEDMERLMQKCNLIWIDHHSSAIQSYVTRKPIHRSNCCARIDSTKAACELTWEYLFSDKPVPLAVKLLGLYDSWTFKGHELEDRVLPFQMRMRMEELDPKDWNLVGSIHSTPEAERTWKYLFQPSESSDEFIDQLVAEGRLLLRYDEANKAKYARTYAFETKLMCPGDLTYQEAIGGPWEKRGPYKAIAVNLGLANSKVFDAVWRMECACCDGTGSVPETPIGYVGHECHNCHGEGYIEPYDLMIPFVRRTDKLWQVQLFTTKDHVDCGVIAKSYGGGGHKGAAGFQCKDLPFEY